MPLDLLHVWPYVGLVLAVAILVIVWREPRTPGITSRWRDPAFVLALIWPMYLVHQFEEHGIDVLGRHYAFLDGLCATLHYPPGDACPADPAFIFAVNGVGCQIAFALAFIYRRERPLVAACAWGIPIVNAFTHLGGAIVAGAYNPGVATSVVLFIPLSVVMLRAVLASGAITRRHIVRILATGGIVHLLLIGSILLYARGAIPYPVFLGINAAYGFLPLVTGKT